MELGWSGQTGLSWYLSEHLRQLQGYRGLQRYREMADNDPVVGGMLQSIEMLTRQAQWQIIPAEDQGTEAENVAVFIESCRIDLNQSWDALISTIGGMLTYGFYLAEVVYKVREGPQPQLQGSRGAGRKPSSKFDDGMIGWRKFAPRPQLTISDWSYGPNGSLLAAIQETPRGQIVLPIGKLALFRPSERIQSPYGRSVLRNAYISWYYKTKIQEIEGIGIERDLAGLPVAHVPPELLDENADSRDVGLRQQIENIVKNIRRDDQESVIWPLTYDDKGNPEYKLELLTTGGQRQFDTSSIIVRHETRMAISLLLDFMLLGHDKIGTQALSVSKIELFKQSVGAWLMSIANVFNRYLIPRLLEMNNIDMRLAPELAAHIPPDIDLGVLGDFVVKLDAMGLLQIDNPELVDHLLAAAGLPLLDPDEGMPNEDDDGRSRRDDQDQDEEDDEDEDGDD